MRKVKKKELQERRRMKKKGVKRGNEKSRKKRTKRRRSKEDVRVLEASKIVDQVRDLESCGGLSWEDTIEDFGNLSDCEPVSRARARMVPDVLL